MPRRMLTVNDHLALADQMDEVIRAAQAISAATCALPKSGPIRSALHRHDAALQRLRSALDTDWHQTVDDAEFARHGHPYYRRTAG